MFTGDPNIVVSLTDLSFKLLRHLTGLGQNDRLID